MSEPSAWDFEALVSALRATVDAAYSLERSDVEELPYSGPELTSCRLLASASGVGESLTADSLTYHSERERDAMTVILTAAVRLGIEQGWRILQDEERSSLHATLLRGVLARTPMPSWEREGLEELLAHVQNPGRVKT